MEDITVYLGLFWNAFIAATLLPAFSEVALAALLHTETGNPLFLFFAATTGNVAGSTINWWLGLNFTRFKDRSWFPFKAESIGRAETSFRKYGLWSLLFAWLPVVGDPLTLIAGVLRVRFSLFLILVTIGKALRYGVIVLTV